MYMTCTHYISQSTKQISAKNPITLKAGIKMRPLLQYEGGFFFDVEKTEIIIHHTVYMYPKIYNTIPLLELALGNTVPLKLIYYILFNLSYYNNLLD